MKKQACLAIAAVAFFLSADVTAQEAALEWEKTFTADARSNAAGNSVLATADGGFVVTGWTNGTVNYPGAVPRGDVYLVKTDAQGAEAWGRTFGGNGVDVGRAVLQTADGGYAVAGDTDSAGAGGRDVYLVKTDAAGILIWEKSIDFSDEDCGYALAIAPDGGFVIAGEATPAGAFYPDICLVRRPSLIGERAAR